MSEFNHSNEQHSEVSRAPDISQLEIPMDACTQPFWDAAAAHRLMLPACADCDTVRWPPGPFCASCQSKSVQWRAAGTGRIYSFTVVRGDAHTHVPALVEFPDAGGVRLLAAIVDTPIDAIEIGREVVTKWMAAANATVPVFRVL